MRNTKSKSRCDKALKKAEGRKVLSFLGKRQPRRVRSEKGSSKLRLGDLTRGEEVLNERAWIKESYFLRRLRYCRKRNTLNWNTYATHWRKPNSVEWRGFEPCQAKLTEVWIKPIEKAEVNGEASHVDIRWWLTKLLMFEIETKWRSTEWYWTSNVACENCQMHKTTTSPIHKSATVGERKGWQGVVYM